MSNFKIGEVVVGCNHTIDTHRNGVEAVVIELLAMRVWMCPDGSCESGQVYFVQWADGVKRYSYPDKLRRRKPPQSDSHERTYMQMWRDMAGKAPQRVGETA